MENDSVPRDRRVWDEGRALARAGFDVVVLCPRVGSDRAPFEQRDGVSIHRYPLTFAGNGPLGYVREYGAALWHTWRIARRLAEVRPFDVVHAANPPDVLLLSAWPLRRRGARMVFDHHDLVPELCLTRFGEHRLLHRLALLLERMTFRLADVVISPNDSYREVAMARGRKRPHDVFVVRNAPDLAHFRRRPPDESLKRGKEHLIAYVGVMGPQDGIDHALHALARLADRRQDWHAIFVGDGDVLPHMRLLAGELGLGDMVEFTGWQDDEGVLRVLSAADLGLAPDPSSPLNDVSTMMKIAEYMAMCVPVISYDLRESRASAGDAAVYAKANDVAEFAQRMDELLADPRRRDEMGALGRARVERSLAWEHSEQSLHAAYRRVLNGQFDRPAADKPTAASTAVSR